MNKIIIFTDISQGQEKITKTGYSYIICSEKGADIFYGSIYMKQHTWLAELYAIIEALHFIEENKDYYQPSEIIFYSDSQPAINFINSIKKRKKLNKFKSLLYDQKELLTKLFKSIEFKIIINYIKAHKAMRSNESFLNGVVDTLSRHSRIKDYPITNEKKLKRDYPHLSKFDKIIKSNSYFWNLNDSGEVPNFGLAFNNIFT